MWVDNQFYYSKKFLVTIAANYTSLYEGLPARYGRVEVVNPWRLAEFKADFDLALKGLGKGKWSGDIEGDFSKYDNFGWLQRAIIADIMGIDDDYLEGLGFYNIPELKSYAYFKMTKFLNGG